MKLGIMKHVNIVISIERNFIMMKTIKKYNKYHQARDQDHYAGKFRVAAYSICNPRYSRTKQISVISYHGSNYDYHFIINELAKEFKGQHFNCLGEKTEKYRTIKATLKKINENNKLVPHKLKFIDSNRFMNASLSSIADNLSKINKQECKKCKEKCKYVKHKNDVLIYKCKKCNNKS